MGGYSVEPVGERYFKRKPTPRRQFTPAEQLQLDLKSAALRFPWWGNLVVKCVSGTRSFFVWTHIDGEVTKEAVAAQIKLGHPHARVLGFLVREVDNSKDLQYTCGAGRPSAAQ